MSAVPSLRPPDARAALAELEERIRVLERRLERERGARAEAERLLADRTGEFARELSTAYREMSGRSIALERPERDPLTRLPNRRGYQKQLIASIGRVASSGGSVALAILDIDLFKFVNETYGQACGDAILEEAAERLLKRVGPREHLCRIGGDKFALISEFEAGNEAPLEAAERMRAAFAEPFQVAARLISCTVSVGCAIYPEQARETGELQRAADVALHRTRTGSRDSVLMFTADMLDEQAIRRKLEDDLRNAIAKGAIDVHYQPIADCATGRIVAVEALARWSNDAAGDIPPDVFVPVAEEIGLVRELGLGMLAESAGQAREWLDAGMIDYFTVNLSSCHLQEDRVVTDILGALGRAGVAPRHLMLELTESLLIDDTPAVGAAIAALRGAGVRFALDDFGSGYSNLAYLRRLPLEKLKIDRSFVRDIETSDAARAIIEHVVGLAHRLGLGIVVEGVETRAQLDFLRSVGTELAQGYYFYPALPADEMSRLLEAQRRAPLDAPGASS
jgi:diguanylate cyclase (GGDEF)-like protein